MQTDQDFLYQMLANADPAPRGGLPPQMSPFPGAGFLGPQLSAMLPMMVPGLSDMMGGGMTFGFGRNPLMAFEARKHFEYMNNARRAAGQADRPMFERLGRGFTRGAMPQHVTGYGPDGQPIFDAARESMIGQFADFAAGAMPFIAAIAPDSVDSMFGQMGSRSAAVDLWANAGRFLTDKSGRAGRTDGAGLMNDVYDRLYKGNDSAQTYGLGSRRVGEIADQLIRRGVIGGADAGNVEKTAKETAETLKEYSRIIAAVRDVFDADGNPNAPMAQLMGAMKAITQRGVGSGTAGLAETVRLVQGATRFSGLGLEEMVGVGSAIRAGSAQAGVRASSLQYAALGVAASNQAYGSLGYGKNASPETLDQAEFRGADAARQVRGAASPLANLAGAVLRQAEYADPNSELGRLADRIRKGEMPAELMRHDAVSRIGGVVSRSGLDSGAFARQVYGAGQDNAAALSSNPNVAAAVARAGQQNDYRQMINMVAAQTGVNAQALWSAVQGEVGNATSDADLARRVAGRMGGGAGLAQQIGTAFGSISTANAAARGATGDAAKQYSVLNLGRMTSEQANAARGVAAEQWREYGQMMEKTTGLGRGTMFGRFMQEIAGLGGPEGAKSVGGWRGAAGMLFRTLGGTDNAALSGALGKDLLKSVGDMLTPGGGKKDGAKKEGSSDVKVKNVVQVEVVNFKDGEWKPADPPRADVPGQAAPPKKRKEGSNPFKPQYEE